MKPDGTDQQQITDFGSMSWAPYMHPSGEYIIFASNKLGFENFELFIVDADGHEGAGARHLLRRLRRPAGAVARRQDARVDVEPRRRIGRPAVPGAVEPREGARGAQERAAAESRARNHERRRTTVGRCSSPRDLSALCGLAIASLVVAAQPSEDARARRDARVAAARGTARRIERRAARQPTTSSSELQKIGAKPLPGQQRLPAAVRVHRRHAATAASTSVVDATSGVERRRRHGRRGATGVQRALLFRQRRRRRARRLRRLRHRRAREPGLRLRQLRDARREGQDRRSCCATSRRTRTRRRKGILARYADLRYKAMAARQHGAKAMLVVTGPRSPNAGELVPMTFDTALAGSGIVAVSVTGDVAERDVRARAGQDARRRAEGARRRAIRTSTGFALPDVTRRRCTPRSCARSAPATTSSPICRRRRR